MAHRRAGVEVDATNSIRAGWCSSLSSPPRLSKSTGEFAAQLSISAKNAAVSGKTQPLGYFSTQRGYSVLDKALCAHWKHCSEGAFDLSTADLPSATSAAAAAAAAISAAAEAAAAAASFASAFSRRSAHAVVRVKGLRLDDIGERVISCCSLCGDGAAGRGCDAKRALRMLRAARGGDTARQRRRWHSAAGAMSAVAAL